LGWSLGARRRIRLLIRRWLALARRLRRWSLLLRSCWLGGHRLGLLGSRRLALLLGAQLEEQIALALLLSRNLRGGTERQDRLQTN
jgi:hypothetical protein